MAESVIVVVLLTFVLMVGAVTMIATLGRRRWKRTRALPSAEVAALAETVGSTLAELVDAAVVLRQQLEELAASSRELLLVDEQLGTPLRRPLWRQIEDANYGQQLERTRERLLAWLARFDALASKDRQVIELLGLDVEPLVELTAKAEQGLEQIQARLEPAIECLRRFERELASHRPHIYR